MSESRKKQRRKNNVSNNKIDKTKLPSDDAIESGIIGTLLKDSKFIFHTDYIKPDMFFDLKLGTLYKIIQDFIEVGNEDTDDFTILSRIEEDKAYKNLFSDNTTIEMREWLNSLRLTGTSSREEYERRCRRLITLDFRRNGYLILDELKNNFMEDNEKGINELNYEAHDKITRLSESYILESDVYLIGDKIHEIRKELDEDVEKSNGSGIGFPSKYKIVNDYFTYEKSELIVIAGRGKSGKSMTALGEVYHKLKAGVPTAIFDTELKTKLWVVRFISHYTGIKVRDIKRQTYRGDYEKESLVDEAYEFLENAPFTHIYDSDWTIEKIETTAKILQKKIGLEFLVYDYIKANNVGALKIAEHAYLADVTNALKNKVAGKLNIAVLAFAQLSPTEERIADSRKIERYASAIVYWIKKTNEEIQEDGHRAGNHKLIVAYNRLGRQHDQGEYLNMVFDGDICMIKQASEQQKIDNEFD